MDLTPFSLMESLNISQAKLGIERKGEKKEEDT